MYKQEFFPAQGGRVGITLNTNWFEPLDDNNDDDKEIAEASLQFRLGLFASPVFTGDFPQERIFGCPAAL